jgi:hypothetical protein
VGDGFQNIVEELLSHLSEGTDVTFSAHYWIEIRQSGVEWSDVTCRHRYTHTHSVVITTVGLNVRLSVHHIFGVKVRRSDVRTPTCRSQSYLPHVTSGTTANPSLFAVGCTLFAAAVKSLISTAVTAMSTSISWMSGGDKPSS